MKGWVVQFHSKKKKVDIMLFICAMDINIYPHHLKSSKFVWD